ncbi:hypothetical protein [Ornithinimicrobium cryptoxanthini]|uniref:hypothetical protein n=1 Tax=Ornithinimicrobium cryptoxanthini TaxID=2934161 RepID=UPI0021193E8D|nr:hypothetical protein [Ornithinimicrobium cryptoxanthini]
MTISENPRPSRYGTQPVPGGTSESGKDATSAGKHTAQDAKESGKHVAQDAKESGKHVAQDAKESGQQVAQTAQEEVRNVASTVSEQARSLFHETSSELGSQAGTQQHRLAEGLRSLSQEFGSMAEGSDESSGQATGLVREAAQRTEGLADWLEQHEPGDVLQEVKGFARRKPGTFIAVAAGIGLLAGRLTRGLTADDSDQDQSAGQSVGTRAPSAQPTTGSYAASAASTSGLPGSGSPTVAQPVGAGPVDPGPMSGIGAGTAASFPASGPGTAAGPGPGTAARPGSATAARPGTGTSALGADDVHGEDPR